MTRFQLVFRENGVDRIETHDNNVAGEPVIDGKLIVDGEVYVIRESNGCSPPTTSATRRGSFARSSRNPSRTDLTSGLVFGSCWRIQVPDEARWHRDHR